MVSFKMAVRMKKAIVVKSKEANVSIKLLNLRVKSFFTYIRINAMLLAKPIAVNMKNSTFPVNCTASIPLDTVSSPSVLRLKIQLCCCPSYEDFNHKTDYVKD